MKIDLLALLISLLELAGVAAAVVFAVIVFWPLLLLEATAVCFALSWRWGRPKP